MRAVGIVGHRDSGKTRLIQRLGRELKDRGHRLAAVKHSLHGIDLQGKDTARLRESIDEVAFLSPRESVILCEGPQELEEILSQLEADIVLIEGFKGEGTYPKIACLKGEVEDERLFDGLVICAIGPGDQPRGANVPLLTSDDVAKIADLVEDKAFRLPNLNCGACGYQTCHELAAGIVAGRKTVEDCVSLHPVTQVKIDGRLLPLNPFTSRIVKDVIVAMLSALKSFSAGEIEIRIGRDG